MGESKKIFVYGAGISGIGVSEVLSDRGEQVILYNDSEKALDPRWLEKFSAKGGEYVCQVDPEPYLKMCHLFIISPGIPFTTETVKKAKELGMEIIAEAEEASRLYKGHWCAITGSNGKTTTTTLLGKMLKSLPVKTAVAGNIGFALSKELQHLDENSYVAAELSSFQLEGTTSLAPDIACIVNITPDHFERHGDMAGYVAAKSKIFAFQKPGDILILNVDDPVSSGLGTKAKSRVVYFSTKQCLPEGAFIEDGWFTIKLDGTMERICQVSDLQIFGAHNEQDVLAACLCAFFAGVKPEAMAQVLKNFKGVEHRLEYVATINGVKYYNDSKATNTDSAVKALEAFKDGHVILLAGGHDKMTGLDDFMEMVKKQTDALILLGEARKRFAQAAEKHGVKNIILVDGDFEEAVRKASSIAKAPEVVLLSPACSSYDMFNNYPERGRAFKKIVKQLAKEAQA